MRVKNLTSELWDVGCEVAGKQHDVSFGPDSVLDLPEKVAKALIKNNPDVLCQAGTVCHICGKEGFSSEKSLTAHIKLSKDHVDGKLVVKEPDEDLDPDPVLVDKSKDESPKVELADNPE